MSHLNLQKQHSQRLTKRKRQEYEIKQIETQPFKKLCVAPSHLHGKGTFAKEMIELGEIIAEYQVSI